MKKKLTVLIALFLVVGLSACGKKDNEIDLSEERGATVDEFDFQPTKAVINKDETIDIYYDWSFGSDEDSMKKTKFISSGVIFFAKQESDWLEDDLVNSSGLYSEVYEKSEASFIIKFKLNNKTDDVVVSFNVNGQPSGRDPYTIKLPEVK